MDQTVVVLAGLVMLIGLLGVILPGLPGLPLVWLAGIGAFVVSGMGVAGWVVAALLTVQLAVGVAAKYVLASGTGAERMPSSTMLLTLVGAAVGFVVLPVVGFVVGGLLAMLLAERRRLDDWPAARASTLRLLQRFGIGMAVEAGAGLAMVVTFAIAVAVRL